MGCGRWSKRGEFVLEARLEATNDEDDDVDDGVDFKRNKRKRILVSLRCSAISFSPCRFAEMARGGREGGRCSQRREGSALRAEREEQREREERDREE